ncbi:UNVERIFIED_CONTAM: universal stress protein [Kocuria sp. CPCC 205316]|uniref:universal stress protein n=1 Tax=Kocuria TaxID=57493 RepID=UPI0034D46AB8
MGEPSSGGRIVVGVDGSGSSKAALREGVRLAEALGAPLEAVMCWEDPLLYESYRVVDPEEFRRGSEQLFESTLAEVFGEQRPENLTTRLLRGQAAARLIEESEDARMLVVGRRGTGGVLGMILGSVSSALVSHAKCPVLVVRH